jgi:glycosyltransferase involved in cell wall biosynthesis
MPTLSVVIPTRDRSALLSETLARLEEQLRETAAELLIVDDGSTDETAALTTQWIRVRGIDARLLRQPARGPAAARNKGIGEARGALVLFLGDDIYPAEGLLRHHLEHHRRYPDDQVAVLGRVTWNLSLRITPLMRWLENGGPQFCYGRIENPLAVPSTFFWTANLSAKRTFLERGGGFSERFPFAAFEDVECGLRLARSGLVLHYEPRALGYHHHPMTLNASLERMKRLAAGALLASETEPGLVFLPPDPLWRRIRRKLVLSTLAQRVVRSAYPLFARIPRFREQYFGFAHDLFYKAELRRLVEHR